VPEDRQVIVEIRFLLAAGAGVVFHFGFLEAFVTE